MVESSFLLQGGVPGPSESQRFNPKWPLLGAGGCEPGALHPSPLQGPDVVKLLLSTVLKYLSIRL